MMDLLLDAVVMETARSQSPDNEMEDNEMEPSTAGSPLGMTLDLPAILSAFVCPPCSLLASHPCSVEKVMWLSMVTAGRDTQRDDARSRRGLRAAPPKSRKLQPPSPVRVGRYDQSPGTCRKSFTTLHSIQASALYGPCLGLSESSMVPQSLGVKAARVFRQNGPVLVKRKRSSMMHSNSGGVRGSALLDDDALGRSPRSVAAKARCAGHSLSDRSSSVAECCPEP